MSNLKKYYQENVKKKLKEKFAYGNVMEIPCLKTIVINMGVAEAAKDKNVLEQLKIELAQITGQVPVVTKAKKSISNFKLRQGQPIGLKVTLRNQRMYDFLERFITIAAPRIRDFRGFPTKCDGQGNYTMGITDQQIFAEIDLDRVKRVQGMNISFVTTAKNDQECVELLRLLGIPFKNQPVVITAAA